VIRRRRRIVRLSSWCLIVLIVVVVVDEIAKIDMCNWNWISVIAGLIGVVDGITAIKVEGRWEAGELQADTRCAGPGIGGGRITFDLATPTALAGSHNLAA